MGFLSENLKRYSRDIKIAKKNDHCTLYQFIGESGQGTITSYEVFPGIELTYNDFNMGDCFNNCYIQKDIMEINHCSQGRFETELPDGSFVYLKEGDFSVNMLGSPTKNSCFPLERYYGISVVIDLAAAQTFSIQLMQDIAIDLYKLRDRLCGGDQCFIMRATASINHIFSELYRVPDEIKGEYFKLKVLELFLFLSAVDVSQAQQEPQYFNRIQVERVKQIKAYLISHLDQHYSLKELSQKFDISLTAMKTCFKGVYGTTIFSFIRGYRMQVAAEMLLKGKDSVTEIAGRVGYSNASKFAAAFKKELAMSPTQYKKNCPIGAKTISLE